MKAVILLMVLLLVVGCSQKDSEEPNDIDAAILIKEPNFDGGVYDLIFNTEPTSLLISITYPDIEAFEGNVTSIDIEIGEFTKKFTVREFCSLLGFGENDSEELNNPAEGKIKNISFSHKTLRFEWDEKVKDKLNEIIDRVNLIPVNLIPCDEIESGTLRWNYGGNMVLDN